MPEDRNLQGLIGDMSIAENLVLKETDDPRFSQGRGLHLNKRAINAYAQSMVQKYDVRCTSVGQSVRSLSGGNQQKVILARWLLANPVYMILDEPTRGIDVGTKVEIQKLVLQLAAEGKSVTFISSEIDEMLRVCSRLVVMRDRQVVGELRGSDLNQSSIMKTIAGGEQA